MLSSTIVNVDPESIRNSASSPSNLPDKKKTEEVKLCKTP